MATHWPPRSPHEALISTPRGRQRFREMQTSPTLSPSRLRMSRSNPALAARYADNEDAVMLDVDDLDDEDEDEEMVQLKLQEIQARMKLKKIQNAKAQRRANSSMDARSNGGRPGSASANMSNNLMPPPAGLPIQSRLAAARDRVEQQSNPVQVPASPVRRGRSESAPQPPQSPQRVMLGIDKGRKAADMSLKRAPSLRKVESERPSSQGQQSQPSGYLRRSMTASFSEDQLGSRRPVSFDGRASSFSQAEERRPMSFNERLAAARNEEQDRKEKAQRIQKIRSNAFSIGRDEMEEYKTKAVDVPEVPYKAPEYSRDEILSATGRSSSTAGARGRPTTSASSSFTTLVNSDNEPGFEPYSGLRLSKRILPHNVVTRAITGKRTYGLKDLLRHVKAPDWALPDVESDVVVFAIVATKSEPRSHRSDGKPLAERGKYMVISLCDLQYEVDLFLFNTGFDRFWKLTPGTILAILNPTIMAPKQGQQDTGRFSLVINSDEDTILEIGNARDLGYCKSVKKDGMLCKSWVNLRRTEYCEFHTNEAVDKSRKGRFELNNTFGGGESKYKQNSRYAKNEDQRRKEEELRLRGQYDRSTGSHFFMNRSAAELIDGGGMADQAEKKEAIKRSLARKEKEAEIARKLGEVGGGAGREYMSRAAGGLRASFSSTTSVPMSGSASFSSAAVSTPMSSLSGHSQTNSINDPLGFGGRPRYDLQALGLLRKKGEEQPKMDLGPIKRKRPESALSSENSFSKSNSNTSSATITPSNYTSNTKAPSLGWGSGLRDKLSRMKEGEKLNLSHRPSTSSMRDSTPALTKSSTSTGLTPAINRLSTSSRDFNFTNSSSNPQTTNLPSRPSPAVRFSAAPSSGTTTAPTTSHSSSLSSSRLLGASASARLAAARAAAAAQAAAAAAAAEGGGGGNSQGSGGQPPVRKKTRFVTDKGIREAGRDSLGDKGFLLNAAQKSRRQVVSSEDEDDDLVIV
ncbi:hypothetical protein QBC45DRAFT_479662 [Copromyces sp. CBS 386.78]|nr:hypothetical protein QBC45DRAFT_479662 [Copromyces sp. CBS 386.78]